ncbi:hypothetical protein [Jiulongibacter sediminis]|uniref:Outer membrane protein beta-barrel domain-containing protein n=1 Tax=Jiulongibacter sediminis TaxID=1605367 RepID=A0A0P7BN59_9BACT|nr:hypothetical protein [Jiulongibacter sediminis]KPM46762.1 hypothetical protein AFM12_18560 [Jiulongibacter sediminis]TBX21666.1 hypothetical protein TK44_18565 [Jiulongibacter sediminis]
MNNSIFSKGLKLFFLFLVCLSGYAQDQSLAPEKPKWEFHGNMQLNNNGISPVPAFSLGRPALMNTFYIKKGNFTFSPEYNFSLDARPWVLNQWVRYRINQNQVYYGLGANFSQFYSRTDSEVNGKKHVEQSMDRYMAFEALVGSQVSEKMGVRMVYWFSTALDPSGVSSGHFAMASVPLGPFGSPQKIHARITPNLFYINNTIPFKGWFTSAIGSLHAGKLPLSLFGQVVVPFQPDDVSKFNWNFGLNYTF